MARVLRDYTQRGTSIKEILRGTCTHRGRRCLIAENVFSQAIQPD